MTTKMILQTKMWMINGDCCWCTASLGERGTTFTHQHKGTAIHHCELGILYTERTINVHTVCVCLWMANVMTVTHPTNTARGGRMDVYINSGLCSWESPAILLGARLYHFGLWGVFKYCAQKFRDVYVHIISDTLLHTTLYNTRDKTHELYYTKTTHFLTLYSIFAWVRLG